jgi:hypothetical protein
MSEVAAFKTKFASDFYARDTGLEPSIDCWSVRQAQAVQWHRKPERKRWSPQGFAAQSRVNPAFPYLRNRAEVWRMRPAWDPHPRPGEGEFLAVSGICLKKSLKALTLPQALNRQSDAA